MVGLGKYRDDMMSGYLFYSENDEKAFEIGRAHV